MCLDLQAGPSVWLVFRPMSFHHSRRLALLRCWISYHALLPICPCDSPIVAYCRFSSRSWQQRGSNSRCEDHRRDGPRSDLIFRRFTRPFCSRSSALLRAQLVWEGQTKTFTNLTLAMKATALAVSPSRKVLGYLCLSAKFTISSYASSSQSPAR